MPAGKDFTLCRTGRGLAASRRPFGIARLPVQHSAARAEVPSCHQTTQPKNEVLTLNRDLTGIVAHGDSVVVANTIVAGNSINNENEPKYAYADIYDTNGKGKFVSCCTGTAIGNNSSGIIDNIVSDPRFVDAAHAKFSLMSSSPCRNKAKEDEYKGNLDGDMDLAHRKRVCGNGLDIGCYEYNGMFMVIVR